MNEQGDFFDLDEARRRRDAGMEKVTRPEWKHVARTLIEKHLPADFEGLGEDLRAWYLKRGYPTPHHPNAWGGLINSMIKSGFFVKIGDWRATRDPKSHARPTQAFRRAA